MTSLFRIFGLLLRKNWQVRKRHWILSLAVQILLPLSISFFARVAFDAISRPQINPGLNSIINVSTQISKIPPIRNTILYAPTNDFINKLMLRFRDCWIESMTLLGFRTESDLLAHGVNSTVKIASIIFNESTDYSTRHLHYKIRGFLPILELYKKPGAGEIINFYVHADPFLQIQICLDKSFIESKINPTDVPAIPQIFIQKMPYPTYSEQLLIVHFIDMVYIVLIVACFTIPLFIEMSTASNEKFRGIHVLMSMNGIPNILNLFSWIISGLIFLIGFCIMMTTLMFYRLRENSYALNNYINPLVLFVFFIAHNLHMMAFGIHVSAYFTKPILVIFAYIILNITAIFLRINVLNDNYLYIVPYMGIIFPNTFLYETMNNINSYKESGVYIQWTNLFEDSNPPFRIEKTLGMTLTYSVVGMIFQLFLAIYVYEINPGKYGIGKHPLFIFMSNRWNANCDSIENCIYDSANNELFESARDYTAGIQIRNLKKSYNLGLFNRKQVQALRGLSIDFYKGQITSLLGHNGAGKSTLISILTGMIKPTGGTVFINSKIFRNNASEILKDVGLCAQEDMYFSSLTVTEQLEFFAEVKKRNRKSVRTLLQKLKLFNVKDALPDCLSADQRRKLCLAIAFVGDPSILVLDEPTSRLDYESKRLIWDILLEMKGRKTILLSTHDMHEADLLADRVAILHEGQLKCYGSSLYLKKMLGGQSNIEITLSIERWSDPDIIGKQIDCEAKIIQTLDKKMIVSVSTSSMKSNFLENLEKKKLELGVLSYSLSMASLEQVFLSVTQGNDISYEAIDSNMMKLKGISLYVHAVRALLLKNMTYTLKESFTLLIQILMIFITLMVTVSTILANNNIMYKQHEIIDINLDMYNNPYALYTSFDNTIGERYKRTCKLQGGSAVKIANTSLYSELMHRAKQDLVDYNKNLIAAAEFNKTSDGYVVNAFYSNVIFNSLPISINLVTNVIIKDILGDNYSISLSKQRLPDVDTESSDRTDFVAKRGYWLAVIFVIPVYLLIAMFVIRPARESSRGLKHLQKTSGVNGFTYWGTLFLSDVIQYTFLVSLLVIGLICMDKFFHLRLFRMKEILIMVLLLMLFAISSLPLVYIFSFIKAKTNTLVNLVVFSCIGIGCVEIILSELFTPTSTFDGMYVIPLNPALRPFQKKMFLLVPHINFLDALITFFVAGLEKITCQRLSNHLLDVDCQQLFLGCCHTSNYCCKLKCYDGECEMKKPTEFRDASFDDSIQFLYISSVIYFCLLAMLEGQLFKKLKSKFSIKFFAYLPTDQQMLREKSMISEIIRRSLGTNKNTSRETYSEGLKSKALLVYELCKHYKNKIAVEDVSFMVESEECFGILGMNRAGKSVTLRMISGEEISDHGIILMGDDRKFFLSQVGYCLQQEAIIKCLNSYDHLRLFARLRGVPEKLIDIEVRTWINQLNISACASLPTSTYSSGNKQRLNIAMALIGNPQLVLLDEPTIRVDPGAKHSFWNTIKKCQAKGQTFVLVSHNMAECEVLCNRMAIMVEGKLTCIGTPTELKQRFGAGYDVQIRMDPRKTNAQLDGIKNTMRFLLDCTLTNENTGSVLYYVSGPGTTWKRLYDVLNKLKNKYKCIDDYIVIVRL